MIIGTQEAQSGSATFKNLDTGEQTTLPFDLVMQKLMESEPELGDTAGGLVDMLGIARTDDE